MHKLSAKTKVWMCDCVNTKHLLRTNCSWICFVFSCRVVIICYLPAGCWTHDQELKQQHWLIPDQLWCKESGMFLLQTQQKACLLCLVVVMVTAAAYFSAVVILCHVVHMIMLSRFTDLGEKCSLHSAEPETLTQSKIRNVYLPYIILNNYLAIYPVQNAVFISF